MLLIKFKALKNAHYCIMFFKLKLCRAVFPLDSMTPVHIMAASFTSWSMSVSESLATADWQVCWCDCAPLRMRIPKILKGGS